MADRESTNRRAFMAVSHRPARAALAAVLAVGFTLFPMFDAAAAKTPMCSGLTPPSPCRLEDASVNWFWSSNTKVTLCVPPPEGAPSQVPGVCGPVSLSDGVFSNAAGVASPISPGHIAVSMKAGDPDMRSYVKFDTGVIPPNSKFNSFVITLTTSLPDQTHSQRHTETQSDVPATVNQNRAKVLACAVTSPVTAMKVDGGEPPTTTRINQDEIDPADLDPNAGVIATTIEPTYDCGLSAQGERSTDGSRWSFDITNIANAWAQGELFNEGVALIPDPSGVADTWTIEFHGSALKVREAVQGLPVPVPVPLPEPPDPTPESDTLVYINEAEESFAVAEFEELPPEDVVAPPAPVAPPVTPPAPVIPSFDQPLPPAPPAPPAPVVVAGGPVAASGPNPGFWWWMIPIGALGLGLYGSAVGAEALAGAGAGNRVASVLRGRRLNGDADITEQ